MVLACRPVAPSMRLAARPVGAARSATTPLCSKILSTWFRIVVLPVPGPPVMTDTGLSTAMRTASRCFSDSISSAASTRSTTSAGTSRRGTARESATSL